MHAPPSPTAPTLPTPAAPAAPPQQDGPLKPLRLGTSRDLEVGQRVYAIGNREHLGWPQGAGRRAAGLLPRSPPCPPCSLAAPAPGCAACSLGPPSNAVSPRQLPAAFGLDHTLTTGVISGTGREINSGNTGRPIQDVIQTDAAINPGGWVSGWELCRCDPPDCCAVPRRQPPTRPLLPATAALRQQRRPAAGQRWQHDWHQHSNLLIVRWAAELGWGAGWLASWLGGRACIRRYVTRLLLRPHRSLDALGAWLSLPAGQNAGVGFAIPIDVVRSSVEQVGGTALGRARLLPPPPPPTLRRPTGATPPTMPIGGHPLPRHLPCRTHTVPSRLAACRGSALCTHHTPPLPSPPRPGPALPRPTPCRSSSSGGWCAPSWVSPLPPTSRWSSWASTACWCSTRARAAPPPRPACAAAAATSTGGECVRVRGWGCACASVLTGGDRLTALPFSVLPPGPPHLLPCA